MSFYVNGRKTDFIKEVKIALSGAGNLQRNNAIKSCVRTLVRRYSYTLDELLNIIICEMKEKGLVKKWKANKTTKFNTFISYVTFYTLANLLRKERTQEELIKREVYGQYSRDLIENYPDNITPETILLFQQLYRIIKDNLDADFISIAIGDNTKTEIANKLEYEYKYFCRVFYKKMRVLRLVLEKYGYDFTIIDELFELIENKNTTFASVNTMCTSING